MPCDDGGVTLTEWGRVDKGLLERYLGNVELGYLPSEVLRAKVTKSVSYKDLNDLNIWSRDGSSFQTGGIEDGDNPGSILDFEKWPIEKRLSSDLAIWLEYRGFRFRNREIQECRGDIVRAATFVNC